MYKYEVSVIITSHNDGDFLADAVKSAEGVIDDCVGEIIVVDDCSTDVFSNSVLDNIAKMERTQVIRNPENVGVQISRARGFAASQSKYIVFLDGDDYFAPQSGSGDTYLAYSIDALERRSDVAFCHCLSEMVGEYFGPTISSYPLSERLIVQKHHVPTFIVFRAHDYPGHDTSILKWQDWSFGVDLLAGRWRRGLQNNIGFFPHFAHRYRIHSGRDRLSNLQIDEYSQTLVSVRKNIDYFQNLIGGSAIDITRELISGKPNRLVEMLHVAQWNLALAMSMASMREADLTGNFEGFGIP